MTEQVVGPSAITISAASARGPLAGDRSFEIRPFRVSLVNAGSVPVTFQHARLDPLCEADSGAKAGAHLTVAEPAAREEPAVLEPGATIDFLIEGRVPARANRYASALRVGFEPGEGLVIPVTVKVSALPAWGIACMLVGLGLLGVVNVLNAESDAQNKLREILNYRQEIHELLERSPVPESQAQDEITLNENLAAATSALHRRRSASIVDRRISEADERFEAAKEAGKRLRDAQDERRPGQIEVEAVQSEWQALQKHIAALEKPGGGIFMRGDPAGMASRLQDFLRRFQHVYLAAPMEMVGRELASEIDRVDLAYASGNGGDARQKAVALRRWMRRAAREMDDREGMILATAVRGRQLVVAEGWIREQEGVEDLPVAVRAGLDRLLAQAAARLGGASVQADFAAASADMEQALTDLTRAESQIIKARVASALEAIDAETSAADTLRVINQVTASPDRSPAGKIAGMTRIMNAWRADIQVVKDETVRRSLLAHVDAGLALLARADLEGVIPENHALRDEWNAWVKRRVLEVTKAAVAPTCDKWRLNLRRQLDDIEKDLRLGGPRSELHGWEASLDQLRFEQLSISSGDCLDRVVALGQRATLLGNAIFTASLTNVEIPADTRLDIAERSGIPEAVALSERLLMGPRQLTVDVSTAETERYVGRAIAISIGNLFRAWRLGIEVRVDFGDGQAPLTVDAEQLGRSPQITHTFTKPGRHNLHVKVAEAFGPGGDVTEGSLLGEGQATVDAQDSPISKVQALADQFLNLRFGLALLIAATLYYWQFHVKDRVFGARGYDYAQAFALGFVVGAAAVAADLPGKIKSILG
jgi:hypothetical protein